jgi:hypothetical protein
LEENPMTGLSKQLCGFTALACAIFATQSSEAATRTWLGTDDNVFANDANWSGGVMPANNDYQDIAVFTENGAPKTISMASSRSVNAVQFNSSTGWTIGAGVLTLKSLTSTGSGTNTIPNLKTALGSFTWSIGTGNTVHANTFVQDGSDRKVTLTGGGTFTIGSRIGYSYSSNNDFQINEGTVRIADSTGYSHSGGQFHIAGENAYLELLTSVASAESQIGTKIIDDTTLGLGVTDIGGGYVRIAVVPEPTTLTLGGALVLLARRRRARSIR